MKTTPFIVFVTFPSSSKEYSYLCDIPGVVQGSEVLANGVRVRVVRTASYDHRATKYVRPIPDQDEIARAARKTEITNRLRAIAKQIEEDKFFANLAKQSPEARKLLAELRKLRDKE